MAKQISEIPSTTTSSNETQPSKLVRTSSDSIPVDLLIEVFSRVPGKSIARFRCVSKLWAYVLDRPDFTELFLSKSSTHPLLFFILRSKGKLFFYSSPRPQNLDEDSCVVATRYQYHTYSPQDIRSGGCTLATGLALVRGHQRDVNVICNPARGEFLNLPKVEVKNDFDKTEEFHFGYDPIGKQFKVLCMTSSGYDERPNTHMVLTLENNGKPNSWRSIQRKFHFLKNGMIRGDVCINDVLYFASDVDGSTVIVSFDVRSEKFGFINTVEELATRYGYVPMDLVLFNCKGKLAILDGDVCRKCCEGDYYLEEHSHGLEFWVLEDHKWSHHVYELSSGQQIVASNKFVGMSVTGELVWSPGLVSKPFYLFFYNLESKKFTRVNIQGFQESKVGDEYVYVDTFLGYEENITKNNTWSELKCTRSAEEEGETRE